MPNIEAAAAAAAANLAAAAAAANLAAVRCCCCHLLRVLSLHSSGGTDVYLASATAIATLQFAVATAESS